MALDRKPIFDAVKRLRGGKQFSRGDIEALDAAINAAESAAQPQRASTGLTEPGAFFDAVRGFGGALDQSQVGGFNTLLPAMAAARWPLSWAAYGLATPWHETNQTMHPVREAYWLSEDWRRRNLRYYPWYGRGYVQLTWEANYRRADEELGLGGALVANPDKAMEPDISAAVLVKGMEQGWFTNKALKDYLPLSGRAGFDAYKEARRIINRTDRAEKIAKEAQEFEAALLAGGWA